MYVDWFDGGTRASRVPSVWREMNALLEALERPAPTRAPALEVATDDDALTLSLVAPGVRAEDVSVSVTGRRLDVRVSREAGPPEGFRAVRQERRQWRVERSFELPFDVRAEDAEARLERGVFTLVLPRVAAPEPVTIEVTGSAPVLTAEEHTVDAVDDEEVNDG